MAGVTRDGFDAASVAELLEQAVARYGPDFSAMLERSRVWVNGESVKADAALQPGDEVAVIPPVSGG